IFPPLVHPNNHRIRLLRPTVERSPYDVATSGIALSTANQYAALADALFGPPASPRLQRDSVALAEQRGLSVEHLLMVNKHAKKLKKRGAAWKLRAELIAHQGTFEEVDAYGLKRVKELGGEKPKEP